MNRSASRRVRLHRMLRTWQLWILLLPAIVWVAVFCYGPMYGLSIAFKTYKPKLGIWGSPWAGLKYFQQFFSTQIAFQSILNTLRLSFCTLLLSFPVPILLALVINQIQRTTLRRFVQTATYVPYFISNVVVVGILSVILNPTTGFVNRLLDACGIGSRMFMSRPEYFVPVYVLSGIWQTAGFNAIIYLSTLTTISPDLYEAAMIDGATRMQRIRYIELPALTPTVVIMLVLATGNMLSVGYEKVYLMQTGMNLTVSEVVSTYVYKVGVQSAQFSFASAVGLFNSVINLLFLVLTNWICKGLSSVSLF